MPAERPVGNGRTGGSLGRAPLCQGSLWLKGIRAKAGVQHRLSFAWLTAVTLPFMGEAQEIGDRTALPVGIFARIALVIRAQCVALLSG